MPIFMKYEGIKGTVTHRGEGGWIELSSCQFGRGRGISSPVGTSAKQDTAAPSITEIVVTKKMDDTSPLIFQESLIGKGRKVTIEFVEGKNAPYLSFVMENALISGYSVSSADDIPTESISINFTKATYTTTPTATSKAPKAAKDRNMWNLIIQKN